MTAFDGHTLLERSNYRTIKLGGNFVKNFQNSNTKYLHRILYTTPL